MNKYLTLLLLTSISICLFGQETKKVKIKHKNPYYNEYYNVLKSDKSIRHGEYEKETNNGKTLIHGQFDKGKKVGTWVFYDFQGNKLREGKYQDDKAYGIWKLFNGQEEPKYYYDFSSQKITQYNYGTKEDSIARIIIDGDTIKANVDHPALPKIEISIIDEVYKQVRYPAEAKDNGKSGMVIVSVIINEDGSSSTPTIYQSVYPSLDKEALRVIGNMDGKWIPATYRGKSVKTMHMIPIMFQLR